MTKQICPPQTKHGLSALYLLSLGTIQQIESLDQARVKRWKEKAAREREKQDQCGKAAIKHVHMECGAKVYIPCRCDSYFCPVCNKRRLERAVERITPVVESWRFPTHIVLTVKNPHVGALLTGRGKIHKALTSLRRKKLWKRVWGGASHSSSIIRSQQRACCCSRILPSAMAIRTKASVRRVSRKHPLFAFLALLPHRS